VNAGRWLISSNGGVKPLWARNEKELFYIDLNNRMTAVPIRTEPTFGSGDPTVLFDARNEMAPVGRTYDVSPAGQTF